MAGSLFKQSSTPLSCSDGSSIRLENAEQMVDAQTQLGVPVSIDVHNPPSQFRNISWKFQMDISIIILKFQGRRKE